jgi:hypothetical protein
LGTICWKCGREVPAGATACPACGAAVAGTGGQAAPSFAAAAPPPSQGYTSPPPPPAAPQFQPSAPPAFQPSATPPFQPSAPSAQQGFAPVQQGYSPAPPPPPASGVPQAAATSGGGGSTVLKVVLIIVGIVVLICVLIAAVVGYGIWRVAHAVHEAERTGNVTIPGASGGSFSVNSTKTYSAEELGTDIYPGATPIKGGMKLAMPNGTFLTGAFSTPDSREQVVAFYKSRFGSDSGMMESDDASVLTLKKSEKEQVMVTVSNKANENDGKTKIVILHTTGK